MSRQAPAPGAIPAPQPYPQPSYAPAPYGQGAYPPYPQPLPPHPGPPPLEHVIRRECEQCGKYVAEGEESVEIYEGVEGRSPQTGQPITNDYPNGQGKGLVVVHRGECAMQYMSEEVCPDEADEALFEMACEQADAMMSDYLQGWGINSFGDLENILRAAGYTPEDERGLQRRMDEDD